MKKTMFVMMILASTFCIFSQDAVESVVEVNMLLDNGYSQEAIDVITETNLALRDEYSQAYAASVAKVTALLEDGLMENRDSIFAESLKLTPERREILYETYKKNNTGPFLLNLTVGFGSGSFVQGDILGGGIAAGADLLGIILFGIGLAESSSESSTQQGYVLENGEYIEYSGGTSQNSGLLMSGGVIVFVGSRIFQSIRAYNYGGNPSVFNETLKNSLGVGDISFFAYPTFNVNTSESGFTAATRIEF